MVWIAHESIRPKIVEMLKTFKDFWSSKISLVNQTTIPANLHGYKIAAINDDNASVILYSESTANFRVKYTATQESVKTQGMAIVLLQGHINAMQQYCMALQQHTHPTIYVPQQQQHAPNTRCSLLQHNGYSGRRIGFQQPTYTLQQSANSAQANIPLPTSNKYYRYWNYCHTHGGNINNNHTSAMYTKPGPMYKPHTTHTNTMDCSTKCMHKTILPSIRGRAHPECVNKCRSHAYPPLRLGNSLCHPSASLT
jgi:hypothetical protein